MKINLYCIGKTDNKHLQALINEYTTRLSKFTRFEIIFIVHPKNISKLPPKELKRREGELLLSKIGKNDKLVLLDEKGKSYSSDKFAQFLQRNMNSGLRNLSFVVGGAWGFSEELYNRADEKLSLSEMTTTHQLIRLFFTEQLYRAFTILEGHPYHNQ